MRICNIKQNAIFSLCLLLYTSVVSCSKDDLGPREELKIVENKQPLITSDHTLLPSVYDDANAWDMRSYLVCNNMEELHRALNKDVLKARPDLGQADFQAHSVIVVWTSLRNQVIRMKTTFYKRKRFYELKQLFSLDGAPTEKNRPLYVLSCFECEKIPSNAKIRYIREQIKV